MSTVKLVSTPWQVIPTNHLTPPTTRSVHYLEGTSLLLSRHELDFDSQISSRALSIAEVQTTRVHIQQIPAKIRRLKFVNKTYNVQSPKSERDHQT